MRKLDLQSELIEQVRRILAEHAPDALVWATDDAMWNRILGGGELVVIVVDGPAYRRVSRYPLARAFYESGLPIVVSVYLWSRLQPAWPQLQAESVVLQAGERLGWLRRRSAQSQSSDRGGYDFLDRRVPFVDAVFRSQSDMSALDEAVRLLRDAELRHGVGIVDCPGIIVGCDMPHDGRWQDECLMPFVLETHFLVSGSTQQQLVIYDAEGCGRMCSFREWGHIMADWADMVIKASPRGPCEHYMSFYMEVPVDPKLYEPWREALFRVIDQKSRIYGWTFAPELSDFTARDVKEEYWNHGKAETVRSAAQPLPPGPTPESLEAAERIGKMLCEHAVLDQAGRFYPSGTHFVLQRDPDTVLWSHGAFISREHGKPPKSRVGWIEGVPYLVIEVRSPSDINRRLDQKIAWWLEFGVRRVWVLDFEQKQIEVFRLGEASSRLLTTHDTLSGDEIVPGFEMKVDEVWSHGS